MVEPKKDIGLEGSKINGLIQEIIQTVATLISIGITIFLLSRGEKLNEVDNADVFKYTMNPCSGDVPSTEYLNETMTGGGAIITEDNIKQKRKEFIPNYKGERVGTHIETYCNLESNDLSAIGAFMFVVYGAACVSSNSANKVLNFFIDFAKRPYLGNPLNGNPLTTDSVDLPDLSIENSLGVIGLAKRHADMNKAGGTHSPVLLLYLLFFFLSSMITNNALSMMVGLNPSAGFAVRIIISVLSIYGILFTMCILVSSVTYIVYVFLAIFRIKLGESTTVAKLFAALLFLSAPTASMGGAIGGSSKCSSKSAGGSGSSGGGAGVGAVTCIIPILESMRSFYLCFEGIFKSITGKPKEEKTEKKLSITLLFLWMIIALMIIVGIKAATMFSNGQFS